MDNDTTAVDAATVLLDLDGLGVEQVERAADGSRVVRVVTADETARACPSCGVLSSRVKEVVRSEPRDLPYGASGLRLVLEAERVPRNERLAAVMAEAKISNTSLAARIREIAGKDGRKNRADHVTVGRWLNGVVPRSETAV